MSGKLGLWIMLTLLVLQVSASCCPFFQKMHKAIVGKNQLIKDPNELPIESSFQKNKWFQTWVLQSVIINKHSFPKHIVQIILTYLAFVPISNFTHIFESKFTGAQMSANGQWMLVMKDCCLYFYDLTTGNRVQTFTTPNQSDLSSFDLAKSRLFVAGASGKKIYLWNTNSSNLVTTLSVKTEKVSNLRIVLNDTRIICDGNDATMSIWTVENSPGHCLFVLKNRGINEDIRTCVMNVDGTRMVCKSVDGTIRVRDTYTGECIETHPVNPLDTSFTISRDGPCIAYITPDGRGITLWNRFTGESLQIGVSSESIYLKKLYLTTDRLVFGDGKIVYVYDLKAKKIIYTRSPFKKYISFYVQDISGAVDRKYLVIFGQIDEEVLMKLYSFETGKEY